MNAALTIAVTIALIVAITAIVIIGSSDTIAKRDRPHGHHQPSSTGSPISLIEIENVLTAKECRALMSLAADRMGAARVVSVEGSVRNAEDRQSEVYWVEGGGGGGGGIRVPVSKLVRTAERLTGLDKSHFERLQIARYTPGGFYRPHYDTCNEEAGCERFRANGGNRHATLLVYLNDDFGGGQTVFPLVPTSITPQQGKAVFFRTTDLDAGHVIRESLHEGRPIEDGHKWIANLWIRERKVSGQ